MESKKKRQDGNIMENAILDWRSQGLNRATQFLVHQLVSSELWPCG